MLDMLLNKKHKQLVVLPLFAKFDIRLIGMVIEIEEDHLSLGRCLSTTSQLSSCFWLAFNKGIVDDGNRVWLSMSLVTYDLNMIVWDKE